MLGKRIKQLLAELADNLEEGACTIACLKEQEFNDKMRVQALAGYIIQGFLQAPKDVQVSLIAVISEEVEEWGRQ